MSYVSVFYVYLFMQHSKFKLLEWRIQYQYLFLSVLCHLKIYLYII